MPRNRHALPVLTLLAAVVVSAILPTAAAADSGTDSQFVSVTNTARAQHGLPRYVVSSDLTAVARRWAAHMAATRTLAHNPNIRSQICCWRAWGENVGVGTSVSSIQRAFMASSPHRANILSTSFTQVGIGTARSSDGRIWVDEVFRRPTSAAASAPIAAPRTSTTRHTTASAHVSRSAVRPPLRPVRAVAVARPPAAAPHRLTSALLRQVRDHLSTRARRDPVAGAFGYLRVMGALGR